MSNTLSVYGFRQAVPTIVNVLKADTEITALVKPENIYPLVKTTEFPLPSISVARVSWNGTYSKADLPFVDSHEVLVAENIQVQVNVFARSYDSVNEIAELVLKSLNGKSLVYGDFKIDTANLVSVVEDVVGTDIAVFQETLTFEVACFKSINKQSK